LRNGGAILTRNGVQGFLLSLTLMPSAPVLAQAQGEVVEVEVSGVRTGRGHVLVAICTRAEFLKEHCSFNGLAEARPGTVTIRVTGVLPGHYAVQGWHDENDNGRIDRDPLGIPTEGIGFSRNAPIRLGPPSFEDAAFTVEADGAGTALKLRCFKG